MRRSIPASLRAGAPQATLLLAALALYELARASMVSDWPLAIRNARRVLRTEQTLHLAWEGPLQRAFLHLPELVRMLNVLYFGHFLFTALFFFWLYRRSRAGFALFRDGFLTALVLATLLQWVFPAAPPRLAGVGLVDTIRRLSGIDIGSTGSMAVTDPVAALPSLHAGFAFAVGLGLGRYGGRRARLLGAVYPLAVVLAIVVTGNHFLLDALAGVAVILLGLALAALRNHWMAPPACAAPCSASPGNPLPVSKTGLYCDSRRGVEQSGSSPGS
ncbi:MAG: phosphatase PAP2 family protein [Gaiellaceae bacterium]